MMIRDSGKFFVPPFTLLSESA